MKKERKEAYTQQIIYLQLEIKEKGKYDSLRNINNLNEQLQMAIEEYKKLQDQIYQKRKSFEDMNQELVIAQKMMMKYVLDLETKLIENYTSLTLIEPNIFADHATSDKFDTSTLYQQTVSPSTQASVPVPLQLQKAIPKPQQSQDEKKSDIIINSFKIVIRSNYPSK